MRRKPINHGLRSVTASGETISVASSSRRPHSPSRSMISSIGFGPRLAPAMPNARAISHMSGSAQRVKTNGFR